MDSKNVVKVSEHMQCTDTPVTQQQMFVLVKKKKKNPPRLETSEIKKNKEMNKETETCREIGKNRRNKQKSKAE